MIKTEGDFKYSIYEGKVSIFSYCGHNSYVFVPSEIEGLPVTKIRTEAFKYNHSIKRVIIGDNVTYIGDAAFRGCFDLEYIRFPEGLYSIGGSCFLECCKLKKICFPEELEYLGGFSFAYCLSLKEVRLPKNIKNIGGGDVFRGCSKLEKIIIEGANIDLYNGCFSQCPNIESIYTVEDTDYSELFRSDWLKSSICQFPNIRF